VTTTRSKFLLSSGAIALTICAFSPAAFAQEAPADGGDDAIIVTGIRKSLSDAANIKREASGVVDAISAEDIGKFPTRTSPNRSSAFPVFRSIVRTMKATR
jgi:hypothetical protein